MLACALVLYAGEHSSNYLIDRVYVYLKGGEVSEEKAVPVSGKTVSDKGNLLRANSFVLFGYLICPDEKLLC